jgi:large subunit ribosomal protein L17
MFRNMVTSLFREERVVTTVPKAKEARRVAERMITFAKRGDLHARRQAARVVRDTEVLKKLFEDIGPRFAERPGGYTRILKTGFRTGDAAPMSILELVGARVATEPQHEEAEPKKGRKGGAGKKAEGAAPKAGTKKKAKAKTKTKAKAKTKKKAAKKAKAKPAKS